MSFQKKHTFQERFEEAHRILQKYPDRIPAICEKSEKAANAPNIDKYKYLLPHDLTVGQFMYVIRKRMALRAEEGIFLFINGFIPPSSAYISEMYPLHKDQDGFIYFTYSSENVFG
jgi:GABA(A) receptor-associated protein